METKVFAARLKKSDEVLKCSSGGAFTAISDYFLNNKWPIVSAVYNYKTNNTEFQLYTSVEKRDEARGSKYMQALPINSFVDAEQWIKINDGNLLFVGMGCQADGFRKFAEIKGFRNRTVIVDIVCHGTSSPKIWREYISQLGSISELSFRDKREGWRKPTSVVKISGKEYNIKEYMNIFYNRCALRPSCYECPYATTERKVDVTIGDFWGIEKTHPEFNEGYGVSLIILHTDVGIDLWEKIKSNFDWIESNTTDCLQPNLERPTKKSSHRETFWKDYQKGGIKKLIKQYGHSPVIVPLWLKAARKVKKILKES